MIVLAAAATTLVAGTFLVASVAKFLRMPEFADQLENLAPVLTRHSRPIAYGVILAEAGVAFALIAWGAWPAFASALLLVTGFSAVVGWNLLNGRRVPCGCFGDNQPLGMHTLVRNALLAVAIAFPLVAGTQERSLLDLAVAEAFLAGALALSAALVWLLITQVAALPSESQG